MTEFCCRHGAQGTYDGASNATLENEFGTTGEEDVLKQILEKGKEQTGKSINSGGGNANLAKGSFAIDTKGKSLSGIQSGVGGGR